VVLVETVGVGQSEFQVAGMVDFFLVLMLPNAGDELQGIKKGILELADALVINKADGESLNLAEKTRRQYSAALELLRHAPHWQPRVTTCSSTEGRNIDSLWEMIVEYQSSASACGALAARREGQAREWMHQLIGELLQRRLQRDPRTRARMLELEAQVMAGETTPYTAANMVLDRDERGPRS
jgi:LAO/AO transport system kinase